MKNTFIRIWINVLLDIYYESNSFFHLLNNCIKSILITKQLIKIINNINRPNTGAPIVTIPDLLKTKIFLLIEDTEALSKGYYHIHVIDYEIEDNRLKTYKISTPNKNHINEFPIGNIVDINFSYILDKILITYYYDSCEYITIINLTKGIDYNYNPSLFKRVYIDTSNIVDEYKEIKYYVSENLDIPVILVNHDLTSSLLIDHILVKKHISEIIETLSPQPKGIKIMSLPVYLNHNYRVYNKYDLNSEHDIIL